MDENNPSEDRSGIGRKILIGFLTVLLLGSVGLYVSGVSLKSGIPVPFVIVCPLKGEMLTVHVIPSCGQLGSPGNPSHGPELPSA